MRLQIIESLMLCPATNWPRLGDIRYTDLAAIITKMYGKKMSGTQAAVIITNNPNAAVTEYYL